MHPRRSRRPRSRTTFAAVLAGLSAMAGLGLGAEPAAAVDVPGDPAWPQLDGLLDPEHLRANDVVVAPDGRIVAAAQSFRETPHATEAVLALAAYTRSGSIDATFGDAGVAHVNANPKVGTTGDEVATAVALHPAGGYVAVGTTPQEELGFVVARFDARGKVVTSFGGGRGFVVDDLGGFVQRSEAVTVDSQGRIVVAGTFVSVTAGVPSGIAVARYAANGSRDTSFGGGDGFVVVDVGVTPGAHAILLQPDDSVIVAGKGGQDAVAVKVRADGTPDPRFGVGGVARVDLGGSADEATGIVQQAVDGRIVIAGTAANGPADVAVAALTPRGELDRSFGTNGMSRVGGAGTVEHGTDLALDEDCGLVVSALNDGDIGVARFEADGDVDHRFAPGGMLRLDTGVHDGATDQDQGNTIAVDPVGGAYVVGGSGGNASLFLHRIAGSNSITDHCPSPFGDGPLQVVDVEVAEGDRGTREAEFQIRMATPPAEHLAVRWRTVSVTADGSDYQELEGSLTLDTEVWGMTVSVPLFPDQVVEGDETFEIHAEIVTGSFLGARAIGTVTILDDDTEGEPPPLDPAPEGCEPVGFVDVGVDNVHRGPIDCLVGEIGIMNGTSPTTFDPAGRLSRAQAATLLNNLITGTGTGIPGGIGDAFADDDGSVHEAAINTMAAIGVISGRADGTFGPGDPVQRDQLVSFLTRAYAYIEGAAAAEGPDAFDDDDGNIHEAAIDAAAQRRWVSGTGERQFSPANPVRRDQAASFLYRVWTDVTG